MIHGCREEANSHGPVLRPTFGKGEEKPTTAFLTSSLLALMAVASSVLEDYMGATV